MARLRDMRSLILWILLSSIVLKLGVLFWVGDIAPHRDEKQYLAAAASIAAGEGIRYPNPRWDPIYQPPIYPLFMGAVYKFGGGAFASKVIQVFLSTATVWLLYLLVRRMVDRRAGLFAAAAFAFYPTLIAFTHYNWSETVFLFLALPAFFLLFDSKGGVSGPRRLLAAGVFFGLAALTRAVIGYLVPLLVPWIFLATQDLRATAKRGGALLLGFGLTLIPWSWHIHEQYGGLVFISSQPGKIWHHAYNSAPPGNVDYGFDKVQPTPGWEERPRVEETNPVLRSKAETRRGLSFLARYPSVCLERFFVRFTYLLYPSSYLVRHLREDLYLLNPEREPFREPLPAVLQEVLIALTVAAYLVVTTLAVLGLFTMPAGPRRSLILLTTFYFIVLVSLTFGVTRYRLLFLPMLLVAAAHAVVNFRVALQSLLHSKRWIPFAVVMGTLCFVWSLYWEKIWTLPA